MTITSLVVAAVTVALVFALAWVLGVEAGFRAVRPFSTEQIIEVARAAILSRVREAGWFTASVVFWCSAVALLAW